MKKTRRFLWALLPVAVALIFASCSSSDEVTEPTPATGTKTVPVKITVGMNDATRATVGSDNSTLSFQPTDKLAVLYGGSLLGELSITENSGASATFAGEVTVSDNTTSYSGATVVLVSSANAGVQTATDYSWANSGTAICVADGNSSALNEAVKKYSYLTGTGTFNLEGENSFTLTQHTAFLNIVVTFEDGTAANENLSVTVTNNSSTIGTGTVTTATVGNDVVAQFVVPVAAGTTLNGATITFTGKDPITLSSTATLAGQSYKVEKTISGSSAPAGVVAVDLGLPSGTKWANMNVGATSPKDYGDYFAWGETEPYYSSQDPLTWKTGKEAGYDWPSYQWMADGQADWNYITKYTSADLQTAGIWYDNGTFVGDGKTVLEADDDAATANWGSAWKMPTYAQMQELIDNTISEWGKLNDVYGRYFYKKDGNGNRVTDIYIFLPAAGYRDDTSLSLQGGNGYYWSSSLTGGFSNYARCLGFSSGFARMVDGRGRCDGRSVRPVLAQ